VDVPPKRYRKWKTTSEIIEVGERRNAIFPVLFELIEQKNVKSIKQNLERLINIPVREIRTDFRLDTRRIIGVAL
jgi:hypothetical protein